MRKSSSPALHGLDVRTLRLFAAIVRSGNLTQAAQVNHLAVGAASRRLSNFEELIGSPLLERHSRGLRLTAPGHLVSEHVNRVLEQLDTLGGVALTLRHGIKGHVRVFSNDNALYEHLPTTLSRFRKKRPDVMVEVEQMQSRHTAQALLRGEANIGITLTGVPRLGLASFPYRSERMMMVVPKGHALSRRSRVSFEETLDYEYIGLATDSSINRQLRERAQLLGRVMQVNTLIGGLHNACRLVSVGMGITMVPECLARSVKASLDLEVIELVGNDFRLDQIVMHNDEDRMNPVERELLQHLREDREPVPPKRRTRAAAK